MIRYCAIIALALACSPANADPTPGRVGVVVRAVDGMTYERGLIVAPGDSLPLGLAWGAARRATSYLVTVAASETNGTWTGLPLATSATDTSLAFLAVSTSWDSVTFTATVESVDRWGPTGKTSSANWKMRRRAGAPGPITVDSSQVPQLSVLEVRPLNVTLTEVGAQQQFCSFFRFASGRVAMKADDSGPCAAIYLANFPLDERANDDEQRWVDCLAPYTCSGGPALLPPTPLYYAAGHD